MEREREERGRGKKIKRAGGRRESITYTPRGREGKRGGILEGSPQHPGS